MPTIVKYGNGVQTRFEVPGSALKTVYILGVRQPILSSDFQSVTLASAPAIGAPIEIDYDTTALSADVAESRVSVVSAAALFGLSGTSSADQSAVFREMNEWALANEFCGTFSLPAGDIWTSPGLLMNGGRPARNYYATVNDRILAPALEGAGYTATRIRVLGSPTNAALMTWGVTDAQAASGITRIEGMRLKNLDLYGPGTAMAATTLAADIAVNATSFQIAGSMAAVGDAIGFRLPVSQGGHMLWVTAQNVTGAGPQTVTVAARQSFLFAITAASAPTIIVAKQTRLLQFGGNRVGANKTVINGLGLIEGCSFHEALSGIALDDTTQFRFGNGNKWQAVTFNVEYGYNVDTITFDSPNFGSDRAGASGTCTNGLKTVTGVATAASLRVGDQVAVIASLPTLVFPENTYITSIAGTTLNLSEAFTGTTGVKTVDTYRGIMVAAGRHEGPFLGGCDENTKNNYTDTTINNVIAGRAQALGFIGDTVGGPFIVNGGYMEACKRILSNGAQAAGGSGGPYIFNGFFIQGADYLTGSPFDDRVGVGSFDLRWNYSGSPKFPFMAATPYSRFVFREGWNWPLGVTPGLLTIQYFGNGIVSAGDDVGSRVSHNFGNAGTSGNLEDRVSGDTGITLNLGTLAANPSGDLPWGFLGLVKATLAANVTFTYAGNTWGWTGNRFRMRLTQDATGGRTVTFGANFVKADGTALGTIAGGVAGSILILEFEHIDRGATKRFVQIAGATAFI